MHVRTKRSVKDEDKNKKKKDDNDISDFLANFAEQDPIKYRNRPIPPPLEDKPTPETNNPDIKKLFSEYKKTENLDEKINLMNSVIAIEPDNADAWFRKGETMNDQFEAWFRKGIEITAKHENELIDCWHKVIKLRPEYTHVWLNLGNTYSSCRNSEQAYQCYNRVMEQASDSDPLYLAAVVNTINMLALGFEMNNETMDKFEEILHKSLKSSDPQLKTMAYVAAGNLAAHNSKYTEAVEYWDEGMSKIKPILKNQNPSHSEKYQIGMWYVMAHAKGKALEQYDEVKAIQWYQTLCKITAKWPYPSVKLAEIAAKNLGFSSQKTIAENQMMKPPPDQKFEKVLDYYDDAIRLFKYQKFYDRKKLSAYDLAYSTMMVDDPDLAEVLFLKGSFLLSSVPIKSDICGLETSERLFLGVDLLEESLSIRPTANGWQHLVVWKCMNVVFQTVLSLRGKDYHFLGLPKIDATKKSRFLADKILETRRFLDQAIAGGADTPNAKNLWDILMASFPSDVTEDAQKYLKDYELNF